MYSTDNHRVSINENSTWIQTFTSEIKSMKFTLHLTY